MSLGLLAILVCLAYAVGFLLIGRLGRDSAGSWPPALRRAIYALSACVSFGFWSSFGVVGLASRRGFDFLPLALGPIAIFAIFHLVVLRMIRISRAQRITSIADFVAVRYGRSVAVAAIVALICLFAGIPFIAIQIQAIAYVVVAIAKGSLPLVAGSGPLPGPALTVALIATILAVATGTLRLDATESHGGLMTALAVETVIRVTSSLALGVFVCWGLFKGIGDLTAAVANDPQVTAVVRTEPTMARWLPLILVAMAASLVAPRQFHVAVVENRNEDDVRFAAWFVPACILAASLFVLPVAVAGLLRLPGGSFDRNFILLALPMTSGSGAMAIVALLLCLSATVGTMVMGVVALSVMTCNDLVVPLLLSSAAKLGKRGRAVVPPILLIRRIAIVATFTAAAAIAVGLDESAISIIGLKPIVLVVQIAPAAIGALVWSGGTARGAIAGMVAGVAVSAYTLLLPILVPHTSPLLTLGPLGIDALRPTDLLGVDLAPLQQGVVWSLAINVCVFVALSLTRQPTAGERLQANVFVRAKAMAHASFFRLRNANVTIGELTATTARFLGPETAERLFLDYHTSRGSLFEKAQAAEPALLQHAERLIATTIGAASARLVISLLLEQKEMSRGSARQIVDDAAFEIQNSRDLLQHAIDIARDGMAIFDADLRLVAWNRAYREMFQFTAAELRIGVPLESLIRSNARRGIYGRDAETEEFVGARLDTLTQPTQGLRMLNAPAGRVLELTSVRLHNGGIFYTYSDATAQAQSEEELEAENETLERRVRERTDQLIGVNMELARAKAEAEDANITKSRFLAAASHDVLQPLSAARLYASSLRERLRGSPGTDATIALADNVDQSLGAVEDVVRSLLEISQLDARATKTEVTEFDLGPCWRSCASTSRRRRGNASSISPSSRRRWRCDRIARCCGASCRTSSRTR
ncbi:MAG: PAS-domain containing protein [Beijerinckiaceae bacterium]|nr:PAS-domain containing protein [Beijerinckiaceae bacterium]